MIEKGDSFLRKASLNIFNEIKNKTIHVSTKRKYTNTITYEYISPIKYKYTNPIINTNFRKYNQPNSNLQHNYKYTRYQYNLN